jgi:hypothetical protein
MQMLYNSDSFTVVHFDVPVEASLLARGGYEIVDKLARKEIFIEGAVAASFEQGVQALVAQESGADAFDAFIETYTQLGQQPLILH